MERWRREYEDVPAAEVEIYFWLTPQFLHLPPYPGLWGNQTGIKLPKVVEIQHGTGILPSKDLAKYKKEFLEYCRRVVALEKSVNNNPALDGSNLWLKTKITVPNRNNPVWEEQHIYCWDKDAHNARFSVLKNIADPAKTGTLYLRENRRSRDDDDAQQIFATVDHIYFTEYDYHYVESIMYYSYRLERVALAKACQQALFRIDSMMDYVKTSLGIDR